MTLLGHSHVEHGGDLCHEKHEKFRFFPRASLPTNLDALESPDAEQFNATNFIVIG
jgi:hypothetical protein